MVKVLEVGLVETYQTDRINRILALTARLREIDGAIDRIRYDNDLVTELADVLRTLGDAKDAVIAELKTV
jgi:hypothetical protein